MTSTATAWYNGLDIDCGSFSSQLPPSFALWRILGTWPYFDADWTLQSDAGVANNARLQVTEDEVKEVERRRREGTFEK